MHALVNPVVVESDKETDKEIEACLSIPGLEEMVRRPVRIRVVGGDLMADNRVAS